MVSNHLSVLYSLSSISLCPMGALEADVHVAATWVGAGGRRGRWELGGSRGNRRDGVHLCASSANCVLCAPTHVVDSSGEGN